MNKLKKMVIIAPGSSLNEHAKLGDFELLKEVDTIAMNKFDWFIENQKMDFLPSHYCWFEQNDGGKTKERIIRVIDYFIRPMRTKCFFVHTLHRHFVEQWMVTELDGMEDELMPRNWSTVKDTIQFVVRCNRIHHGGQLEEKSPNGWHLPFLCVYGGSMIAVTQLIYMLGFRDIAIIGADLGITPNGGDHFDPDYESGLDSNLDYDKQDDTLRIVHTWARERFEEAGGRYVNCGIEGELDVLERMELRKWINSSLSLRGRR